MANLEGNLHLKLSLYMKAKTTVMQVSLFNV